MAVRAWRFVFWPDHPEPIDVAAYRRGERLVAWLAPLLASLNVASRFAVAYTPESDVAAYDRFLAINLTAHTGVLALGLFGLRGERSVATHRALSYAIVVGLLLTSLPGLWLLGSITPNVNFGFFALTIAVSRVVYDARLGLWAFACALAMHGGLVALEIAGVVRSQALVQERVMMEVYRRPTAIGASFGWIAATYVLVWALSSYVAYRFRASEHALRELNAGLEERVREQVGQLERAQRLRRYVAPQLADQILRSEIDPVLVRERRPITVMFADLRGFTPMVERLPPDVLATVLNKWFDEVARIAFSHGGTIDKFIGDAVMVFFGAPEALGEREQALRCVRMALEIQRRARELGDEFVALGTGEPLQVRIGIASGLATVGSFGAAHRADYTVVGAAVNRAARLEPLAPPGGVLVDDETCTLVGAAFVTELAGEVSLKGFAQPVHAHRIVGEARKSVRPAMDVA